VDQTHDGAAEKAVLACCLGSKLARDRTRAALSGGDFYEPLHEEVWDAMNRLDRQDMAVDGPALLAVVPQHNRQRAGQLLVDLVTYPVSAESVTTHCAHVRQWAQKRRLWGETLRAQQEIMRDNVDIVGLAASTAARFAAVRDAGGVDDDIEAMTLDEIMLEVPEDPDWVIPGFLERGDRFLLTAAEGAGKSHWTRQVAIMASAGLDPFRPWRHIRPVRGMIIDFENSKRQIRRRTEATYGYAVNHGRGAAGLATVLNMGRSDITQDRVLNKIHRELDACQPEVLAIGPLYKMSPKALQTDDEAGPVLAALDTIRERGIAILIEAHAGHVMGAGRRRDLRPRGSAALMGWPEFGYGMTRVGEKSAVLTAWRGDRDERTFPMALVENGWGWEEERATTVQDVWRPRQDWTDLAYDEE
jgi:replicative DNA helicase